MKTVLTLLMLILVSLLDVGLCAAKPEVQQKDWIDILSALLVPTIAILGFYIAYRQSRLDHLKFKHDLFDRRWKQFDAAKVFVQSIIVGGIMKEEKRYAFVTQTKGSRFLFDAEISLYFDKINDNACEHEAIVKELAGTLSDQERQSHLKKKKELMDYFLDQLKTIEEKFIPYLEIEIPGAFTDTCQKWVMGIKGRVFK